MPAKQPLAPLAPALTGDDPDDIAVGSTVAALEPPITAAERRAHQSQFQATEASLKKQPKVRIRLPEDTLVQINGYGFWIQGKVPVDVPEQVAEVLAGAGRI